MGCTSSKPKSSKRVKKTNLQPQVPPLHANVSIKSVLSTKSALSPRKGSIRRPSVPSLEKRVSFNGVDDILNADELKKRPTMIENPSNGHIKLPWLTKLKAVSNQKAVIKKRTEQGGRDLDGGGNRIILSKSTSPTSDNEKQNTKRGHCTIPYECPASAPVPQLLAPVSASVPVHLMSNLPPLRRQLRPLSRSSSSSKGRSIREEHMPESSSKVSGAFNTNEKEREEKEREKEKKESRLASSSAGIEDAVVTRSLSMSSSTSSTCDAIAGIEPAAKMFGIVGTGVGTGVGVGVGVGLGVGGTGVGVGGTGVGVGLGVGGTGVGGTEVGVGLGVGGTGVGQCNIFPLKVRTPSNATRLGPTSLLARGISFKSVKPLSVEGSKRLSTGSSRGSSNSSVDLETDRQRKKEKKIKTYSKEEPPVTRSKVDSPTLKVKIVPPVFRMKIESSSLRCKSEPQILRVKVEPPVLRGKEEPLLLQVKVEAQVFREIEELGGRKVEPAVQNPKKFTRPSLLDGWEWDRKSFGLNTGTSIGSASGTGTGTGGVVEGIALAISPATAYVHALGLSTWDAYTNINSNAARNTTSSAAAVPASIPLTATVPVPVPPPIPDRSSIATPVPVPVPAPLPFSSPLPSVPQAPGTSSPSRPGKLLRPISSRERLDSVICDISDYYKQAQVVSPPDSFKSLSHSLPLSRTSSGALLSNGPILDDIGVDLKPIQLSRVSSLSSVDKNSVGGHDRIAEVKETPENVPGNIPDAYSYTSSSDESDKKILNLVPPSTFPSTLLSIASGVQTYVSPPLLMALFPLYSASRSTSSLPLHSTNNIIQASSSPLSSNSLPLPSSLLSTPLPLTISTILLSVPSPPPSTSPLSASSFLLPAAEMIVYPPNSDASVAPSSPFPFLASEISHSLPRPSSLPMPTSLPLSLPVPLPVPLPLPVSLPSSAPFLDPPSAISPESLTCPSPGPCSPTSSSPLEVKIHMPANALLPSSPLEVEIPMPSDSFLLPLRERKVFQAEDLRGKTDGHTYASVTHLKASFTPMKSPISISTPAPALAPAPTYIPATTPTPIPASISSPLSSSVSTPIPVPLLTPTTAITRNLKKQGTILGQGQGRGQVSLILPAVCPLLNPLIIQTNTVQKQDEISEILSPYALFLKHNTKCVQRAVSPPQRAATLDQYALPSPLSHPRFPPQPFAVFFSEPISVDMYASNDVELDINGIRSKEYDCTHTMYSSTRANSRKGGVDWNEKNRQDRLSYAALRGKGRDKDEERDKDKDMDEKSERKRDNLDNTESQEASVSANDSAMSVQDTARNTSKNATTTMAPSLVIGSGNRSYRDQRRSPCEVSVCPIKGSNSREEEILWREVVEVKMNRKLQEVSKRRDDMIHRGEHKEEVKEKVKYDLKYEDKKEVDDELVAAESCRKGNDEMVGQVDMEDEDDDEAERKIVDEIPVAAIERFHLVQLDTAEIVAKKETEEEEKEEIGEEEDEIEEVIEEEIEDDLVLAIDIAQTPLSPVDPSQSSLFVNTSRNVTHTPSSFISKPLSTLPSPSKKFSSISSSTSTSSSISTSISNPNSTDGEAVSTTCDMGVDRHPYPPLSILTERDAEEEEEEEEGEKGHGLLGPFLTAKELSPLCIYLAVKATKNAPKPSGVAALRRAFEAECRSIDYRSRVRAPAEIPSQPKELKSSWGKHILRPMTPVSRRMTSDLGANMSPERLYDSPSSGTSECENSDDNTPTAASASRRFFENKVKVSVASQPGSPQNLPSHPKKFWGYSPYSGAQTPSSLNDQSLLSSVSREGEQERERERERERSRDFASRKAVFQSSSGLALSLPFNKISGQGQGQGLGQMEGLRFEQGHEQGIELGTGIGTGIGIGLCSVEKGATVSKRFQEKVWEAMLIRERQQQGCRDRERERDRLEVGSSSGDDLVLDSMSMRTRSVRDIVSTWSEVARERERESEGSFGRPKRDREENFTSARSY